MTKTYRDVQLFILACREYLNRIKKDTKPAFMLRKASKHFEMIYKEFTDQNEDIEYLYCSVDNDAIILRDKNGNLQFTKDNMKKKVEAQRALFEKEVTIELFPLKVIPDDLTIIERDAFLGFVIPEEPENEADSNINTATIN